MEPSPPTAETIARAAAALRAGRLVAFPTETVYGLGALASSDEAIAALYAAKGRPAANPLIIHLATRDRLNKPREQDPREGLLAEAAQLADLSHKGTAERAERLARACWPGPLTIVLPLLAGAPVSARAVAHGNTIALRAHRPPGRARPHRWQRAPSRPPAPTSQADRALRAARMS